MPCLQYRFASFTSGCNRFFQFEFSRVQIAQDGAEGSIGYKRKGRYGSGFLAFIQYIIADIGKQFKLQGGGAFFFVKLMHFVEVKFTLGTHAVQGFPVFIGLNIFLHAVELIGHQV